MDLLGNTRTYIIKRAVTVNLWCVTALFWSLFCRNYL